MLNSTEAGLQFGSFVKDEKTENKSSEDSVRKFFENKERIKSGKEKSYSKILPEVTEELEKASNIDELIEHLENVDSLFNGYWDGKGIDDGGFYYGDFPEESDTYCYLMEEAFLPTLSKLEKSASSLDQRARSEVVQRLEIYIEDNYEYDTFYFDRLSKIVKGMLQIDGINALPAIARVSEYITDDSYQQPLIEDYGNDYDSEPSVFYDKVCLEFDSPDHRHFHSSVVKAVSQSLWDGDEKLEAAKFLTEYLGINSEGNLKEYVKAFENLSIENASTYLLENLKSEDVLTQRMSAEILFRLELGKTNISEDGVEYLGKLYDLGKYNDPDLFVRRLNNSGLIGVLGGQGEGIKGVFSLDLFAEKDVIQAEVRQLMSQELFLPKADETPEQRESREKYLQLFLESYDGIFNDDFFDETGVRLNTFNLHEQGWFVLNYLSLADKEGTKDLERLKSFVTEYGEYGLKSFLSLEYGGSAQDILEFTELEKLTKEEKKRIFKNFYAIANQALNWREIFSQIDEGVDYEFAPQVHEAFIRKSSEFFKAAQLIVSKENSEVSINKLFDYMNNVAFSLRALQGLYEENSNLKLEQKPQFQDEYDEDGNLVEGASSTYIFKDNKLGSRIVVSIRTQPTVKKGNVAGGEARINFKISDTKRDETTRIGFDLSDYGEYIGDKEKPPVVSLDLGVGVPDREEGIWPSQRVGKVLGIVEGSEGGHNELSFEPEAAKHFPDVAVRFRSYIQSEFVE